MTTDRRPTHYTVTIRPEPAGADRYGREPVARLRLLLKHLLRLHGFRAVRVAEHHETRDTDPQGVAPACTTRHNDASDGG